MQNNIFWILLISLMALSSCKKDVALTDYSEYIGNPDNKIVQSRNINGLITTVQYIPKDLDVYKEIKKDARLSLNQYDSLLKEREGTVMFWISFEPEKEVSGDVNDVMMRDVHSYQQYNEKFLSMNFDLKDKIRLKTAKGEYEPIYALLENTFGLGSGRKAIVFFGAEKDELELTHAEFWEFIYSDDTFGIGTLHFLFEKAEIERIPECNFRQILRDEKK